MLHKNQRNDHLRILWKELVLRDIIYWRRSYQYHCRWFISATSIEPGICIYILLFYMVRLKLVPFLNATAINTTSIWNFFILNILIIIRKNHIKWSWNIHLIMLNDLCNDTFKLRHRHQKISSTLIDLVAPFNLFW